MVIGGGGIVTVLAGRYEITRQLGGGGFAITLLARDIMQPSKPLCVVKQLRPNQTQPRIIEFFHQEAAILEKLGQHPQIPRLLAHFQEGDDFYIVQEFIQGQDLTNEIYPGKKLSENYVHELLQDVLEVLSFVHQQGVIHRDIKPQNLMRRREDGKIFLIDFGAVKELGTLIVNTQGQIASSIAIGTPGYMPTEQGLGKPCFASDIYAVGIIAIAALTGIPASELEENPETGELIWLDRAEVSSHLAKKISKMVRRHFSLRYSSANDALQAFTHEAQTTQSTLTTLQIAPKPKEKLKLETDKLSALTTILYTGNDWKRRKFIQTIGLVGGGFITAVLGQQIFSRKILQDILNKSLTENNPSNDSNSEIAEISEKPMMGNTLQLPSSNDANNLKSFGFEIVTINQEGKIVQRKPGSANYFTEELGNGITLDMVEIPAGKFIMGSSPSERQRDSDESPQREVNLKPFFMGKFTVTQGQYQAVTGKNRSVFKQQRAPVESVNWNDAIEFCQKLTEKTGREYRLPTEAEWEYACRAKTTTPFYFGETISSNLANYNGNSTYGNETKGQARSRTTEVGTFPPNAFGLYDMHGNVWEWCQDTLHKNYNNAPNDGSAWIRNSNNRFRVLRGGSWNSAPSDCRCANRHWFFFTSYFNYFGFRVVCDVA
ncbi:MAG: bifunctional serine/threonine-protein kinase/formylglycine-generating enzyme family protein [Cyanobacteria bacterium J06639_18]